MWSLSSGDGLHLKLFIAVALLLLLLISIAPFREPVVAAAA